MIHISGYFTYPAMVRSRCSRISEGSLYCYWDSRHAKVTYLVSRLSYPSVGCLCDLQTFVVLQAANTFGEKTWWDTRLNMQAQAEEQHNACQLQPMQSFRSTRMLARTVSPLPLLSIIGTTSETPSLNSSTVLLLIKRLYSMQLFAL